MHQSENIKIKLITIINKKKKKKKKKKISKRKVQGVPQSQTAALPRHQEECSVLCLNLNNGGVWRGVELAAQKVPVYCHIYGTRSLSQLGYPFNVTIRVSVHCHN